MKNGLTRGTMNFAVRSVLWGGMVLGVAACSSVPSMDEVFPDRKNDYKDTREIADLEVPPGLTGATLSPEQVDNFQARPEQPFEESGFDSPYDNNSTLNDPVYDNPAVVSPQVSDDRYRAAPAPAPQTYAVDPDQQAISVSTDEERIDASLAMLSPLAEDEPLPDVPFALSDRTDPPFILARDGFSNTWTMVEGSIVKAGYQIAGKFPEQGFFSIVTPEGEQSGGGGLLSSLAFWRDDETPQASSLQGEYLIHVAEDQGGTVIEVLDMEGFSATSAEAARILRDMHEQLK